MSRSLFVAAFALLLLGSFARTTAASADDDRVADVHIKVLSLTPPRLVIDGELVSPTQTWSFRKTYGGLLTLGERIDHLTLSDSHGNSVEARRLAPGEYKAAAPATRFRYEVKLDPPARSEDAAYVSWLTADRGVLMPGDLMPALASQTGAARTIMLSFELPAQWLVSSAEKRISNQQFRLVDADAAVFFVGKDLQQRINQVKGMELTLVTSGQWALTPDELLTLARSIVETHAEALGGIPGERALVILSPFPKPESAQRWSAETRGRTVFLLAGLQPAKTAAMVQLSLPLTHELFHLWVPNGLALDGDYDWFYEGFTIYQAMRASQRLNLLTFQDVLNAVARAIDTYSLTATRDNLSLVEASQRRWTTNPSVIYQKAMVVAFLYDLTVRIQTGNKRSLEEVYRELFRRHRAGLPRALGNDAVIKAMSDVAGMHDFAARYIRMPTPIDLSNQFARFGLRVETLGMRTRISVNDTLNREQRDLLRRLGYNSETRRSRDNH
jgi:predicted metalloprotease with PDZ domain